MEGAIQFQDSSILNQINQVNNFSDPDSSNSSISHQKKRKRIAKKQKNNKKYKTTSSISESIEFKKFLRETLYIENEINKQEEKFYKYLFEKKGLTKLNLIQLLEANSKALAISKSNKLKNNRNVSIVDESIHHIQFLIQNLPIIVVFFNAKNILDFQAHNWILQEEKVKNTKFIVNLGYDIKKIKNFDGLSYFVLKNEERLRCIAQLQGFQCSLSVPASILTSLNKSQIQKMKNLTNDARDNDGMILECRLIGQLDFNQDIEELVISKKEYRQYMDITIKKLSAKGIKCKIEQSNELRQTS